MFNTFARTGILLLTALVTSCFLSCGDVETVGTSGSQELEAIEDALRAWRTRYETEDIDAYMNVFWADGFRYISDMGTPDDTTDDVKFDDIREER